MTKLEKLVWTLDEVNAKELKANIMAVVKVETLTERLVNL